MTIRLLPLFILFVPYWLAGQSSSRISGSLQSNGNFFIRDEKAGASGTPQYDYQKFGAESWLALTYAGHGVEAGVRMDMFNNSNLLNPLGSFNGVGIGRWYAHKQIDRLDITGGYIYDQIGSGIIFRAYEERALMIDNALVGVRLAYKLNDNWQVKAFTGRTKQQFGIYGTAVRGIAAEGFIKPDSARNFSLAPGLGVIGRAYDDQAVNSIVQTIATYVPQDSIGAQYNTYAATLYNTMTAGPFTWYVEGAMKSKDVMFDPFAQTARGGAGKLVNRPGYVVYTSLAYAAKGLGVTLEAKRTKDFSLRTSPFQTGVQGQINFLPPMSRQNAYRLTARFPSATQELGEQAIQLDLQYKLTKKLSLGFNFSNIYLLDADGKNSDELYRELTPEFTFKQGRKWQLIGGLQFLRYNIAVYQGKIEPAESNDRLPWVAEGKKGYVDAFTPYAELLYKFTPRRSLRVEAQYLLTDDEFGSWFNLGAELGLAPHWLIYASDMYKIPSAKGETLSQEQTKYDGLHYPSVGAAYTYKAYRFALEYVKQVEGINCAGGICRYEPTFYGARVRVNAAF